jgi:hypothetical protein
MFTIQRSATLGILVSVLFSLHLGAGDCVARQRADTAPIPQQPGSLTGTITAPDGRPVMANSGLLATGAFVNLQEYARTVFYEPGDFRQRGVFNDVENGRCRVAGDLQMGGLYRFTNLRPGVYNLVVEESRLPKSGGSIYYRPQRVVGIVVKPGEETVFDIVVHPTETVDESDNPVGNTLEMVGDPRGNVRAGLKWGWIEGTVTNAEGQPIWSAKTLLNTGVSLTLRKSTGEQATIQTDHLAGGFFSAASLLPGTYDLILEKGMRYQTVYRPQIVGRVTIGAGVRTVLHLTMHPGDPLERVAAPPAATQPIAVNLK